jgi:hypothetical protein
MHAHPGDMLVVPHPQVGVPDRTGQILQVKGDNGSPPYVVQWNDDTRSESFIPGPEATITPKPPERGTRLR